MGHTGCGAVTAAYDATLGVDAGADSPAAVHAAVERLVPLVEAAQSEGVVDADTPRREAVNRLVEYAVREQVAFLDADAGIPSSITVAGFVYDFQAAYGGADGTAYLVSLDGETDADRLCTALKPAFHGHVRSLLPSN